MSRPRRDHLHDIKRVLAERGRATIHDIMAAAGCDHAKVTAGLAALRLAGEARSEQPPSGPGAPGLPARHWLAEPDPALADDLARLRDLAFGATDPHGRAERGEVVAALRRETTLDEARAMIDRMIADGDLDVVGGLIGRPDRLDERTPFGGAVETFRALGRPFLRAEALRLLPDLAISHVDTILMRACELGFLVREAGTFRGVRRHAMREPTADDTLAVFPREGAVTIAGLRGRMNGFRTRQVANHVALLVQNGKVVKCGRGSYARADAPAMSGDLSLRGRALAVLRGEPERVWTAPEVARLIGHDDVQDIRMALNRLLKSGDARRLALGSYVFVHRKSKAPIQARGERTRKALRAGADVPAEEACATIRSLLLSAGGFAIADDTARSSGLSASSFQAGLDRLQSLDLAFVFGRSLISLDPPFRLDRRGIAPRLRLIAETLFHGTAEKAMAAGALADVSLRRHTLKNLVKEGLLVAGPDGHVLSDLPQLDPLRRLVRAAGTGALSRLERRVFDHVRANPGLRKAEIARGIDAGRGAVNRAVDAAVAKGTLVPLARDGQRFRVHPDLSGMGVARKRQAAAGRARAKAARDGIATTLVARVRRVLNAHPDRDFGTEDMARALGMTQVNFQQIRLAFNYATAGGHARRTSIGRYASSGTGPDMRRLADTAPAPSDALTSGPTAPDRPGPTRLEQRVLDHLRVHPDLRKAEIARGIGTGRGSVNRAVDGAVAKGLLVEHEGRYRGRNPVQDGPSALRSPAADASMFAAASA